MGRPERLVAGALVAGAFIAGALVCGCLYFSLSRARPRTPPRSYETGARNAVIEFPSLRSGVPNRRAPPQEQRRGIDGPRTQNDRARCRGDRRDGRALAQTAAERREKLDKMIPKHEGYLGALAPENLKKKRPAPPFDLTEPGSST